MGPDEIYRQSRRRLTALLAGRSDLATVPVAACPGWSVHDVAGHLVAVADDALAGRLTGPPTDEETAEQVARHAGRPTAEVLADWQELAPRLEAVLAEVPVWPAAFDVLTHEHDVRTALGCPGHRQDPAVVQAATMLVGRMSPPVALRVELGEEVVTVGPEGTGPGLTWRTTPFEAFRVRLGRRSRSQLAGLAWDGDPTPVLDQLCVFGPSPHDIDE